MESPQPGARSGASALQTAAALVVVVAGLKLAAGLLVPVVFAALLALILMHPVRALRRRGLRSGAALILVLLAAIVVVAGLTALVGKSVAEVDQLDALLEEGVAGFGGVVQDWCDELGLDLEVAQWIDQYRVEDSLGAASGLVAEVTQGVLVLFSDFALILLILVFMLLEANGFPTKLRRALGDEGADLGQFERVSDQVFDYVSVKAGMSFLTGVLVAGINFLVGVELAVVWGLIAFLFNFVPNVGSFLAAIPAVLMAALQPELGIGAAGLVALGYLAVNLLIGNVLEPRVMGRRLGLSPLVVILSLVFWSWVWGPVGMLLSLPLTMVVKILLEHSTDGRFAAVLLGPADVEE